MLEKLSNTNTPAIKQVEKVEGVAKLKEVSADTKEQMNQDELTREKAEKIVVSINQALKDSRTHLKFQFHEELKEYYVALVDDTTNEVVKEIPPRKLLDMYAAMTENLGLFVDKKG